MSAIDKARLLLRSPMHIQKCLEIVHAQIYHKMKHHPVKFTTEMSITKPGKPGKPLIRGDVIAEEEFSDLIERLCGSENVVVEGEESLGHHSIDLSNSDRLHVLCDIIDGTDLLIRGFSNWCSALVCFDPANKEILSSFVFVVGSRQSALYCATSLGDNVIRSDYGEMLKQTEDGVLIPHKVRPPLEVERVSNSRKLEEASICAYGQKLENMIAIGKLFAAEGNLEYFGGKSFKSARFYNLAGNPMMCRILDGAVDIVFDVVGQAPHDVVPGAYIALKGGAHMYDLGPNPAREDRSVSASDLVNFLYRPSDPAFRMRYVIAATQELGRTFVDRCRVAGLI